MFKIITFEKKNNPESVPNDSRISPESFQSNFHIIFTLWDPQTVKFQLKSIKKFESMPEIWQEEANIPFGWNPSLQRELHEGALAQATLDDGLGHLPADVGCRAVHLEVQQS